jgi:hypothetical protein
MNYWTDWNTEIDNDPWEGTMSKSKAVNWTAIKKRYLQGEKPKDIAADYGLTS